jgi:hypothetical protein
MLLRNASAAGVNLQNSDWATLDGDQRYALIKVGHSERPSHNFTAALKEFLAPGHEELTTP